MSTIDELKKQHGYLRLDIGCGENKQPGFVGMDMRAMPGVDFVHNCEEYPWPFLDNTFDMALASHLVEHINPANWGFMKFMDEVWRVLRPGGEFVIIVPYAGSGPYWQDPTHINGITEITLCYFDPDDVLAGSGLWGIYRPKPWRVKRVPSEGYVVDPLGLLQAVLVKREEV